MDAQRMDIIKHYLLKRFPIESVEINDVGVLNVKVTVYFKYYHSYNGQDLIKLDVYNFIVNYFHVQRCNVNINYIISFNTRIESYKILQFDLGDI